MPKAIPSWGQSMFDYHIQFVDPIDFNKRQFFDMNGVDSDE